MIRGIAFVIFNVLILSHATKLQAQSKEETRANVAAAVAAQRFIITAQSATGQKGRTVNLTGAPNTILVTKDTFQCYLPYYGRSYNASIAYTGSGGVECATTQFTCETKPRKKGGWELTIKPANHNDVQNMVLTIGPDGYTTANVTLLNRSPMTYYGVLAPRNP